MAPYFTDREFGERTRTSEIIDERVWGGLYGLIKTRMGDDSFGYRFPEQCPDGIGPCGVSRQAFELALSAEIPEVNLPLTQNEVPPVPVIMDLLEFCSASIGKPIEGSYHPYFQHSHLVWDREAGLASFVSDVNRLFARNGIAFELSATGEARRLLPEILAEALAKAKFATGDQVTDQLLEVARLRIAFPKIQDRQDALEKIWDAFERLKTLEPGDGKAVKADALLDRVASPGSKFREMIAEEAKSLTVIGNAFGIRHSETTQEHLSSEQQIDYLFVRMFSFVRLVLQASGRGG